MKVKCIQYDRILDNCGSRRLANLKNVNKYIKEYDWKKCIMQRHHKYIELYIQCNYNINKLSSLIKSKYNLPHSVQDLSSIFLRIESQFELYRNPNKILIIETEKRECTNKVNHSRFSKRKEIIVKEIINEIKNMQDLELILPKNLYDIVIELKMGMTINELARKRNGSPEYLINTIIGSSKPRNNCEKGVRLFIDEYHLKNKKVSN